MVMHIIVVSPRTMNIVFKRIDFAIQKSVVAQLVVSCLLFMRLYMTKSIDSEPKKL